MWIITTRGFYSAVRKQGDVDDDGKVMITVRARVKADLERLDDLLPGVKPYRIKYSDYPWRIRVRLDEWAFVVEALALEIDYANFKNEVKRVQGAKRANVYSNVWSVLRRLSPTPGRGRRLGRGWSDERFDAWRATL